MKVPEHTWHGKMSSKVTLGDPEVTSRSCAVNKDGGGVNDLLTLSLSHSLINVQIR